MNEKYRFSEDFDLIKNGFDWMSRPSKLSLSANGLLIEMDAKKDFWRKTYYKPLLVKNDGHVMYKSFPVDCNVLAETRFSLEAVNQFDQAGIIIYFDAEHWIKTGIEYVDGKHKLSCVVTNSYSDWSTQSHPAGDLSIRLYKLGQDAVVEAKQAGEAWNFIRICHMGTDVTHLTSNFKFGLFACAPTDKGGSVCFEYLRYTTVDHYHHSN